MIPLQMIMGDESADTRAGMILSQGNHPTKALVINKVDNSRGSQKEFGSLWCPSSLKRVVPIAVKGVRFEVKLVHLSVTNLQACFVSPLV